MTELLVLLHGLGGTGDVWRDVAARWDGETFAPDLLGHGTAPWSAAYTFSGMAEAVAAELPAVLPEGRECVVLGHSLGGVVGLELARLVPAVRRVVGIGIKVEWTDDELSWARGMAERPVAWFDIEAGAISRYRKVSGVGDLVAEDIARAGVVADGDRWRLTMDPRTFAVGRPDMQKLLTDSAERGVNVVLARGERDPMSTDDELRALVADPVSLAGLGHHAHLEAPEAVVALCRAGSGHPSSQR